MEHDSAAGAMKELFERAENDVLLSYRDLHIILDAMPIAISWATLPEGQIRFCNRAFRRTFGYPDGTFTNVDQWIEQAYMLQEHRDESRRRWKALWQARSAGMVEVDAMEVDVRCADGSTCTALHRGLVLYDIGVGVATFENITERKIAEDALRRVSLEDPLTGVANRRALQQRWAEEIRPDASGSTRMMALVLVDLDAFKPINDRFGHDVGDHVLKVVAGRLRDCVRSSDLVSRLGGDEFVVLLSDLNTPDQAEAICERITATFSQPVSFQTGAIMLNASIGASLYPQHGQEFTDVLRYADEALYRMKNAGNGGWQWFSEPGAVARQL